MIKGTKKTNKELIAIYESKIKKLKQEGKKFNKDMPGVAELLTALDVVLDKNNLNYIDVIIGISKMKRTGLVITKPARKPKATKALAEDKPE